MSSKNRNWCGVATGALLLFLLSSHAASAQTPSPWTGVIRDDAEQAAGAFPGFSVTHQRSISSNQRWAYVKFDLTSVPTISDAKLRVFGAISGTTSNVIQTAVYPVADTNWSETGITWNNKPSVGAGALSVATVVTNSTTPRWYELDVTAYLQAEKAAGRNLVTLALKYIGQSTKDVELNSKEATSDRPALFVVL